MGRKSKYKTLEEKKIANNEAAKSWYQKHKNDPSFIERRKWYQIRYYDNLDVTKKQFFREYNTDYIFYVRNVVTGKFEKKIADTKEKADKLINKIKEMEERRSYLINKFGHLKIGYRK